MFDLNDIIDNDIKIDDHTIYVSGNPIGVMVPGSLFANKNGEFFVSGRYGVTKSKSSNKEDKWKALIESGAILFGAGKDDIDFVQSLLNNPMLNRTTSYLCSVCDNCQQVKNIYNKISKSNIAIVGVGGIGSLAAMILCGSGINSITLIDNDLIDQSNLNRQFFYKRKDIGKSKTSILKREIEERYEDVLVNVSEVFIGSDNISSLLKGYDGVLVSADSPSGIINQVTKFCLSQNTPVVGCGYFHSNMLIGTVEPHNHTNLTWSRLNNSIFPSFGPTNVEISGVATSLLLLKICAFINKDIFTTCDSKIHPRSWASEF
jgi:molybdopterin/thiamine biosynthesis adenylyltransferase